MAHPGLIETGLFTYNGHRFGNAAHTEVSSEPIRDQANRTIVAWRIRISVQTFVSPDVGDPTADAAMQRIRRALRDDGKELVYTLKGFGNDLRINTGAGGIRDLDYGPKSGPIRFRPLGNSRTVQLNWSVTTTIPECDVSQAGFMAWNYTVQFSFDGRGDMTRTISGYVEVPKHRIGSLLQGQEIDLLRPFISPGSMAGFTRTHNTSIDHSKRRLNFSVTDRQIPSRNPWPENVINIRGNHRVNWNRREAFNLRNTISVRIDPRRGFALDDCYQIFHDIVRIRKQAVETHGWKTLLTGMSIDEEIFGFGFSASVDYLVYGCITDIIRQSGIFTPVGGDWNAWADSLLEHMFDPYGNPEVEDLHYLDEYDAVINICGGQPVNWPEHRIEEEQEQSLYTAFQNEQPEPDKSFAKFELGVSVERDRSISHQRTLETADENVGEEDLDGQSQNFQACQQGTAQIIQKAGKALVKAWLGGSIIRVGHRIAKPLLKSVKGAPVEEQWGQYVKRTLGTFLGQPVFSLDFLSKYAVESCPDDVEETDALQACFKDGQVREQPPEGEISREAGGAGIGSIVTN